VVNANFVSTLPDFTFTTGNTSATVSSGSPATYSFTLTPVNNLTGPVTFDCTPLPLNAHCIVSPSPFTIGAGPATATLTITTNGSTTAAAVIRTVARATPMQWNDGWSLLVVLLALPCGLVAIRRSRGLSALILGSAITIFLLSCGGGGGGTAPTPLPTPAPPNPNTPAGTYVINVTMRGQSPVAFHGVQLTLVVK
jgi:hypothetical protein